MNSLFEVFLNNRNHEDCQNPKLKLVNEFLLDSTATEFVLECKECNQTIKIPAEFASDQQGRTIIAREQAKQPAQTKPLASTEIQTENSTRTYYNRAQIKPREVSKRKPTQPLVLNKIQPEKDIEQRSPRTQVFQPRNATEQSKTLAPKPIQQEKGKIQTKTQSLPINNSSIRLEPDRNDVIELDDDSSEEEDSIPLSKLPKLTPKPPALLFNKAPQIVPALTTTPPLVLSKAPQVESIVRPLVPALANPPPLVPSLANPPPLVPDLGATPKKKTIILKKVDIKEIRRLQRESGLKIPIPAKTITKDTIIASSVKPGIAKETDLSLENQKSSLKKSTPTNLITKVVGNVGSVKTGMEKESDLSLKQVNKISGNRVKAGQASQVAISSPNIGIKGPTGNMQFILSDIRSLQNSKSQAASNFNADALVNKENSQNRNGQSSNVIATL